MEESFEKWAEEKASEWVDGLNELRKEHKILDDDGFKYVLMKALRAGHAYGNNAEKQS